MAPTATSAVGTRFPRRALHLLLVEDNLDTVRAFSRWLREEGHVVATATSVAEALALDERGSYDVLICDIGLPDGTGWQLVESLRQRHPTRAIAVSGFASDADIQHSKDAGFIDHLVKPIRPHELESILEQVAANR
jgi:CheY-like chemotaxis protein